MTRSALASSSRLPCGEVGRQTPRQLDTAAIDRAFLDLHHVGEELPLGTDTFRRCSCGEWLQADETVCPVGEACDTFISALADAIRITAKRRARYVELIGEQR